MPQTFKRNLKTQRGVSLYLAFMIMTVLMGISLGMSTLLLSQIGILKGMGHSVLAFYATDTGVDHALYIDIEEECADEDTPQESVECLNEEFDDIEANPPNSKALSNGAAYQLEAEEAGTGACPAGLGFTYCVKATGMYEEARRSVRVAR